VYYQCRGMRKLCFRFFHGLRKFLVQCRSCKAFDSAIYKGLSQHRRANQAHFRWLKVTKWAGKAGPPDRISFGPAITLKFSIYLPPPPSHPFSHRHKSNIVCSCGSVHFDSFSYRTFSVPYLTLDSSQLSNRLRAPPPLLLRPP
jgi:hypothetical protein